MKTEAQRGKGLVNCQGTSQCQSSDNKIMLSFLIHPHKGKGAGMVESGVTNPLFLAICLTFNSNV